MLSIQFSRNKRTEFDTPALDTSMASIFKVGQALKGRLSTYTLTRVLHRAADDGAVFLSK